MPQAQLPTVTSDNSDGECQYHGPTQICLSTYNNLRSPSQAVVTAQDSAGRAQARVRPAAADSEPAARPGGRRCSHGCTVTHSRA